MSLHFPKSRDEWLKLRHSHISSTESSALFGMNPYMTAFELAVSKKSDEPESIESTERMAWGTRLQRSIAQGIAEEYGVNVRAQNGYASLAPECRMGASFDFEIIGEKDGPVPADTALRDLFRQHGTGVLEIKNVDSLVFKNEWDKFEKSFEAPPHIELQVAHQLECINRKWAAIGVLIGGNRLELLTRVAQPDVGNSIRAKVNAFWKDLEAGKMPPVELPADATAIRRLYSFAEPGSLLDYQKEDNEAVHELARKHLEACDLKAAAERHHKATSAALLMAIGSAEKVLFKDCTISAGMIAPTRIEAYDRAGYRNLRIFKKSSKEKVT